MWHAKRGSFFWVDIQGKRLHEYNWLQKTAQLWTIDHRPSLIVTDTNNRIVVAVQAGIYYFDPVNGSLEWLLDLEKDAPDHRTNDGRCDSEGRLWIGTMQVAFEPGAGTLYCIDTDLTIEAKLKEVTISNGIAWSPDNKRMYYIDTPTRKIQSFLFDAKRGTITFEKIAVTIPPGIGKPDGMAIDEEGMLWVAQWGGAGVYRYNPESGMLLSKIEVAAQQVSSCAFGGPLLDQLIITTATDDLSDENLAKYPDSGNVFIASPGVRGVPSYPFGYSKKTSGIR